MQVFAFRPSVGVGPSWGLRKLADSFRLFKLSLHMRPSGDDGNSRS
jgi:hypothetical protein